MGKQSRKKKQTGKSTVSEKESPAPVPKAAPGWLKWQGVIVFLTGLLLYVNTIPNEYAVDDTIVITKNRLTTQGLKGIPEIMTTDAFYGFFGEDYKFVAGGRYRPLSIVTFAIEYEFLGQNPHFSHFINALMFGLTCWILFLVLVQLFPYQPGKLFSASIPFLTALLFAAHPIHTEAVANIKGRDEVMALLGALCTLWFSIRYYRTGKPLNLAAALVLFALSLLSKENSITYLAVIPLAIYFFHDFNWKRTAILLVPMTGLSIIYILLRQSFTDVSLTAESPEILNNPFYGSTLMERWATMSWAFVKYFQLLIFPHPLTHDYYYNQIPIINWSNPRAIFGLVLNLGLIAYGIAGIKKKNPLSFAILYYYVTISVFSNILFSVGIIMNERFVYMPSVGFCLAVGLLLTNGVKWLSPAKKPIVQVVNPSSGVWIFMALILAGYSMKTIIRNTEWKNDFVLFGTDVHNSPNSAKVHNSFGGELVTKSDVVLTPSPRQQELLKDVARVFKNDNVFNLPPGEVSTMMLQEAERVLSRALEIYPTYLNALLLMGNTKYKLYKDVDQAREYYLATLKLKPRYFEGNFNLGTILLENDKPREALPYLSKALKIKPEKPEAYANLARCYMMLDRADTAVQLYTKYFQLMTGKDERSARAAALYKVGSDYGKEFNRLDYAIQYISQAVALEQDATYYLDLGVAYGLSGNLQKALDAFERAIALDPDNAPAWKQAGDTYKYLGNEEKAREYHLKAQQLSNKQNNL